MDQARRAAGSAPIQIRMRLWSPHPDEHGRPFPDLILLPGQPAEALQRLAAEGAYDLVVVGGRGSGLSKVRRAAATTLAARPRSPSCWPAADLKERAGGVQADGDQMAHRQQGIILWDRIRPSRSVKRKEEWQGSPLDVAQKGARHEPRHRQRVIGLIMIGILTAGALVGGGWWLASAAGPVGGIGGDDRTVGRSTSR